LHTHIERFGTDQTSTGPSTLDPQSVRGSDAQRRARQTRKNRREGDDLIDIYGDPVKLLKYRHAVAIRMEEEEDCLKVSQYASIQTISNLFLACSSKLDSYER
jgi:hypothetical protein